VPAPPRATLPRSRRLAHASQFQRVYAAKMRKARGPLAASSAPNDVGHYRLGLAIGRSVGNAVTRHRLKRLVREAFRLSQHDLPGAGYDLVISARGVAPDTLEAVRALLVELALLLHAEWDKRARRRETP
jgi:ribonuclease P protein component